MKCSKSQPHLKWKCALYQLQRLVNIFGHFDSLFIELYYKYQKGLFFANFDTFFSLFIVPSDWTCINMLSSATLKALNDSVYFDSVMSKSKVENCKFRVSRGQLQKLRYNLFNKKFIEWFFCINIFDSLDLMMINLFQK